MLRQLWVIKSGWDVQAPAVVQEACRKFGNDLPTITEVRIPRWLNGCSKSVSYEFHIFYDASKYAHSAAIYLRHRKENEQFVINLLMAKCKINLIKPKLTPPRAELCAAVLAVKLLKFLRQKFFMHVLSSNIYYWTDSSIVSC